MSIKHKKPVLICLMLLSLVSAPLAGATGMQGAGDAMSNMDHENCVCQHGDPGIHGQHSSDASDRCIDSDHEGCSNCLQCGHCQHASTYLLKHAPGPMQRAEHIFTTYIASLISVSGSPDYRPPRLV